MLASIILAAAGLTAIAGQASQSAACAAAEPLLGQLVAPEEDEIVIFDIGPGIQRIIDAQQLGGITADGVSSPTNPDIWMTTGADGKPVRVAPPNPATVQAFLSDEPRNASVCHDLQRLAVGRGARIGSWSREEQRWATERGLVLKSVALDLPVLSADGDEAIAYEQVSFNGRFNGSGLVLMRKGEDGRWRVAGYGPSLVA